MTDNSSNDDTRLDTLLLFTAENLLSDSPFLEQVIKLRDSISRNPDGTVIDYDAVVHRIKDEVDALPSLELQQDVPAGSEGAYQRQLLHALERINDDHDRVTRKLLKIKSRLVNALTMMKIQRGQFTAFYSLAFPIAIHTANIPGMKLSMKAIENMASGEYSRLMDNLDNAALSTISEIGILEVEIKSRKAAQAVKYQLGKDQVNAMWNSFQSNGAIGLDDDPNALLKQFPVEEDGDEVPSFVSRHTKEVRVGASIKKPEAIGGVLPPGEPFIVGELKGTFHKQGDPKPVTPIEDDGGDLVVIRKPMVITMPEWSKSRLLELAEEEDNIGGPVLACSPEIYAEIKKNNEEVIGPDEEGLAAIAELARKANAETMAEIEATRQEKMKKLVTAPEISITEVMKLTAPVDACEDDFSNEPLVRDYKAKWDDLQPTTTKAILIEDIEDSAPHTMQEASKLMEEATLGEALEAHGFKPIPGKALVLPEGVKPVEDIESILNAPEPLATQAPVTPRRKLMILDEDEL